MSWSGNITFDWTDDKQQMENAVLDMQVAGNEQAKPARDEQVRAAQEAAIDMLLAGAVGSGEGKAFTLSISGHANEGHEPAQAWSNDFVSIRLQQDYKPKPA